MQIHDIRNIQFTRVVKADGRLREFNFRIYSVLHGDLMITVDVVDDRGNRIVFKMQKEQDAWKIIPGKFPAWIMTNETVFHDQIEEELRQAS